MPAAENFAATRWTLVIRAGGDDTSAGAALSELCDHYYAPVLAFLRSEGRDEDSARELAHGFFQRLLAGRSLGGANPAQGRFRSYLLGAVKHFLLDERLRARAEKRGGGARPLSLDEAGIGEGASSEDSEDSERAFDRQWALTVIARALESVAAEFRDAGKSEQFEVLKPWITGAGPGCSQAESASVLGMSEGAVKVAIHRLRQRFREDVKSEIRQTVPIEDDVHEELRYLIRVLAH
jgi:DNA-directed RNA polymerase specialized sigma24 family protein